MMMIMLMMTIMFMATIMLMITMMMITNIETANLNRHSDMCKPHLLYTLHLSEIYSVANVVYTSSHAL